MTQGFDFTRPSYHENLESSPVRLNFQSLSTFHKGPTLPASPQLGFAWLDDSNPNNWKLKWYVDPGAGPTWKVVLSHLESTPVMGEAEEVVDAITFLEGINPPALIDVDAYSFEDAAGFDPDQDQDIIFRIPAVSAIQRGINLSIRYFVNTVPVTGLVRLKLDYTVVANGDDPAGGTSYSSTMSLSLPPGINIIDLAQIFTIPSAQIPSSTSWINCRLSRLGTHISDTYNGTLCLMSIHPRISL